MKIIEYNKLSDNLSEMIKKIFYLSKRFSIYINLNKLSDNFRKILKLSENSQYFNFRVQLSEYSELSENFNF